MSQPGLTRGVPRMYGSEILPASANRSKTRLHDDGNGSLKTKQSRYYPYSVLTGGKFSNKQRQNNDWEVGDWCWEEVEEQKYEDDGICFDGWSRRSWCWLDSNHSSSSNDEQQYEDNTRRSSRLASIRTTVNSGNNLLECEICCVRKPVQEISHCPNVTCRTNVCAMCQLRFISCRRGVYDSNHIDEFSWIDTVQSKRLCCQTPLDVRVFAKKFFARDIEKLLTSDNSGIEIADRSALISLFKYLRGIRKATESARADGFYNEDGPDIDIEGLFDEDENNEYHTSNSNDEYGNDDRIVNDNNYGVRNNDNDNNTKSMVNGSPSGSRQVSGRSRRLIRRIAKANKRHRIQTRNSDDAWVPGSWCFAEDQSTEETEA